jgi:predicted metal-binding protein
MRNKFPGTCYQCGKPVAVGEGHFERFKGGWRVQHVSCCLVRRDKMNPGQAKYIQQKEAK